MSTDLEPSKETIETLQQQVKLLQTRRSQEFELLKWGMGIFTTIAILFASYNWWTAKTNYERDKATLQQQADLSDKKLALLQDKTTAELAKQSAVLRDQADIVFRNLSISNLSLIASALATASNNLDSQFFDHRQRLTNIYAAYNILASSQMSNVQALVVLWQSNMLVLNENNKKVLSNVVNEMNVRLDKVVKHTEGQVFMNQGLRLLAEKRTKETLLLATSSFLTACGGLLEVQDEINLLRSLKCLCWDCLPPLTAMATGDDFIHYEVQEALQKQLGMLITQFKTAEKAARYDEFFRQLELSQEVIRLKVESARRK